MYNSIPRGVFCFRQIWMISHSIDKSTDVLLCDIPYAVPVPLVFYMFSDSVNKEKDTLRASVFLVLLQPGIEYLFRSFYDVVSFNGLFIYIYQFTLMDDMKPSLWLLKVDEDRNTFPQVSQP